MFEVNRYQISQCTIENRKSLLLLYVSKSIFFEEEFSEFSLENINIQWCSHSALRCIRIVRIEKFIVNWKCSAPRHKQMKIYKHFQKWTKRTEIQIKKIKYEKKILFKNKIRSLVTCYICAEPESTKYTKKKN